MEKERNMEVADADICEVLCTHKIPCEKCDNFIYYIDENGDEIK